MEQTYRNWGWKARKRRVLIAPVATEKLVRALLFLPHGGDGAKPVAHAKTARATGVRLGQNCAPKAEDNPHESRKASHTAEFNPATHRQNHPTPKQPFPQPVTSGLTSEAGQQQRQILRLWPRQNDGRLFGQGRRQPRIPPLRCGMTTRGRGFSRWRLRRRRGLGRRGLELRRTGLPSGLRRWWLRRCR